MGHALPAITHRLALPTVECRSMVEFRASEESRPFRPPNEPREVTSIPMETQRSYTAHHQRCSDDATPGSRRRGLSGNGGWRLLSWSCAHRFDGSSSHQGVGIYRQHGEDNRPHRETRPDFWFVIAPWRRASARGYGRFC
jgi:hypothetical protein